VRSIYFLFCCFIAFYANCQDPEKLLLRDFRPVSIYNIPKTKIFKARFPVIDVHSHPYAKSQDELEQWVKTMDSVGIEKTIIQTYATGARFDSLLKIYSGYGNRFEIWCGFDYTGYKEEDWSERALKELNRCYKLGATGVGELGDKGLGLFYSYPTPAYGMHIDDPRMQPLIKRCGELNMPISIHVAEPYWMYLPMDSTNDGLMNAYKWRIDKSKDNILLHEMLITTLENAVKANANTIFIACHLANCSHDLSILGNLLDSYPNLYAEIGARYAEFSPIPKYAKAFFEQYQDRLLYGTDMGTNPDMYKTTFRILETSDEHFYEFDRFGYHWPLYGLGLGDETLRKLYSGNARKILK